MALLEQDRESWCLLVFFYKEEWGGWLGYPFHLASSDAQLVLNSFSLGPGAWPAVALPVTLAEICLSVFFPLTVHAPSKCSCNISLHAASTIKKHDLVEKILTFLGSACPAAV